MPLALVVDDDEVARRLVRDPLERAGWEVAEADTGRAALERLFQRRPDIVLLDIEMPELDGWQTLERIRDMTDVPVVMITASGSELEKVRGLKGGADDYVTKPFGRQELLARVEAVVRRSASGGDSELPEAISDGVLIVDPAQGSVTHDGAELSLTPVEYRLITALLRNRGQILSRDQLLELVWGGAEHTSGAQVKVHVGRLRKKLEEAGLEDPIETVRGFGYRYRTPAPA